jgi:hypothetical protein
MNRKIKASDIPATLNGHRVVAFVIRADREWALVIVYREGHPIHQWIAATWWPELGDSWEWGNYYYDRAEADAYGDNWIKTYGAADHTDGPVRIKISGRMAGLLS